MTAAAMRALSGVKPAPFVVLNIPCTHILSSHDERTEAERAARAGGFVYEISAEELAAWHAEWNAIAPIVAGLPGDRFEFVPNEESARRAYFDERARIALHGTASGESMADWGPHYLRQARAMMRQHPGQLWERLAERASQ